MTDLETQILAREWFYEFKLPSGAVTRTKIQADVLQIHKTRLHMMCQAIEPFFGEQIGEATAIDVASHEGYFSYHLAHRCAKVRGLEVNPANVAAAELIRAVFDLANLQFIQIDINELDAAATEPADLVVAFGGGTIDWGHHLWQIPLRGIFGVVEGSPGACEGGTTDIELVPSRNGLIWILGRLGFTRVEIVEPPADAYHQLKTGRRIMLAAYP